MSSKLVILLAIVANVVLALMALVDPTDLGLRGVVYFAAVGAQAALISLMHANVRKQAEEEAREESLAEQDPHALFQAEAGSGIKQRGLQQFERVMLPVLVLVLAAVELSLGATLWRAVSMAELAEAPRALGIAAVLFVSSAVLYLFGSYVAGLAFRAGQGVLRAVAGELVQLGSLAAVGGVVSLMRLSPGLPDLTHGWARLLAAYLILRAVEKILTVILERYRPRGRQATERLLHESRLAAIFAEPRGVMRNVLDTMQYQFGIEVSEAGLKRAVWRGIPALVVVEAMILVLASCLVFVQGGERVLLERAGKKHPTRPVLEPGMHLKLPWPIERVYRVPMNTVAEYTVTIGAPLVDEAAKDDDESAPLALWTRESSQAGALFLTANAVANETRGVSMNMAALQASVHYGVADPTLFLYTTRDPQDLMRLIARREVAGLFASTDFDGLLRTDQERLSEDLRSRIQVRADALNLGIRVNRVVITSLQPPAPVAAAFEEVFSAEEQRQGDVLLARSEAVRTLATNKADVQRILSEAEGYRHAKISQAQAEAPGFAALHDQYLRFPMLVTERMYLTAVERALQNQRKVILPAGHPNQVINIDLKKRDMSDLLNP